MYREANILVIFFTLHASCGQKKKSGIYFIQYLEIVQIRCRSNKSGMFYIFSLICCLKKCLQIFIQTQITLIGIQVTIHIIENNVNLIPLVIKNPVEVSKTTSKNSNNLLHNLKEQVKSENVFEFQFWKMLIVIICFIPSLLMQK